MALESFPPLALVAIRFTLSGSLMLAVAGWRGSLLPRGRDLRNACISGVLILGIGNGALVFAELRIPSGLAGLFITISPFWLVGIEALLPGGERLHWPTIFGMLVGLCGAALLVAPEIVVGAIHQLAAGLACLPLALLLPEHPIAWSLRGAAAVLYLVVFGSIVGYSSYAYALDKLPVAVVSVYPYINSIVAVGLGWLVYREPFGWIEAVAMIVIFAGVALVKRNSMRRAHSLSSTLAPIAPPAVQKKEITMNQNSRKNR